MDTIDTKIQQANERLKAANIKITIERNGCLLSLRGTFPSKNGVGNSKQQRIPLRITATLEGVREAELEANAIRKEINLNLFKWEKYIALNTPQKTVEEWLEEFERNYFSSRARNSSTITTWKTDYLFVFRRLPKDAILDEQLLRETILRTEPDTQNRRKHTIILSALARFVGIEVDFKRFQGRYGIKNLGTRDIPCDKEIFKQYHLIDNPYWRWVYGILATYGLRNHEVFRIDFQSLREGNYVLTVLGGKTGSRKVWPIYPEWFDQFNLSLVKIPQVNLEKGNAELGRSVTTFFFKNKLLTAYSLRHAWAIRSIEFGLDVSLAAQQMGHSFRVHSEIYHHWISEHHHQKAYDALLKKRKSD